MFNQQFNSEQFNQDHVLLSEDRDSVEFNGYSLMSLCPPATTGIAIQKANFFDLTNIDIAEFVADQIDGGGVIQKKYGNKNITLQLMIQGSTHSDLIARIDDLKKNTQSIEADLDVLVRGETRTYTATVSNIRVPAFKKTDDYIQGIEMDVLITSPHWKLKNPTSVFISSASADFEKIVSNDGTKTSFPRIIIACKPSGNAITLLTINLKKVGDVTGYDLTISEALTNDDVLVIDYRTKIVTLNDVEINFSGVMTEMELGYNVFDFDFTGTVSADIYISYNKTYL